MSWQSMLQSMLQTGQCNNKMLAIAGLHVFGIIHNFYEKKFWENSRYQFVVLYLHMVKCWIQWENFHNPYNFLLH